MLIATVILITVISERKDGTSFKNTGNISELSQQDMTEMNIYYSQDSLFSIMVPNEYILYQAPLSNFIAFLMITTMQVRFLSYKKVK